jgi:hypothetical protein
MLNAKIFLMHERKSILFKERKTNNYFLIYDKQTTI